GSGSEGGRRRFRDIECPPAPLPGTYRVWGDDAVGDLVANRASLQLVKGATRFPQQKQKRLPGVYLSWQKKSSICAQMGQDDAQVGTFTTRGTGTPRPHPGD